VCIFYELQKDRYRWTWILWRAIPAMPLTYCHWHVGPTSSGPHLSATQCQSWARQGIPVRYRYLHIRYTQTLNFWDNMCSTKHMVISRWFLLANLQKFSGGTDCSLCELVPAEWLKWLILQVFCRTQREFSGEHQVINPKTFRLLAYLSHCLISRFKCQYNVKKLWWCWVDRGIGVSPRGHHSLTFIC
jgi:hypothetical protein